jgi:hypothetical protein
MGYYIVYSAGSGKVPYSWGPFRTREEAKNFLNEERRRFPRDAVVRPYPYKQEPMSWPRDAKENVTMAKKSKGKKRCLKWSKGPGKRRCLKRAKR